MNNTVGTVGRAADEGSADRVATSLRWPQKVTGYLWTSVFIMSEVETIFPGLPGSED